MLVSSPRPSAWLLPFAVFASSILLGIAQEEPDGLAPIFREAPPAEEPPEPAAVEEVEAPAEPVEASAQGSPAVPEPAPASPFETYGGPVNTRSTSGPGFQTGVKTAEGARILNLSIPAPRGQIVDRNGAPFAQNVVAYYLGLNFPQMEAKPDEAKLEYARDLVQIANQTLERDWSLEDEEILEHYETRRWLPLVFSNRPLTQVERNAIESIDVSGLILIPTYERHYPQRNIAAHIIGFVGKRGPWPTGEIPDGEALWPTAEGVRGLEKEFEADLTGVPGRVQIIFNGEGEKVEETVVQNPVPGHNVILSIDLEMQQLAARVLESHVKRGALVIMEVQTGDILAMASFPSFDPNDYIPRISVERQAELVSDPEKPLYGRAFQGTYPPASTFKVAAALGMLEAGTVNEYTTFDCPPTFTIGDRIARNWNEDPEGYMNIIGAITRSCNTWFFAGAMETSASNITIMGQKLGFGAKTGIPLPEERAGLMPTNEWYRDRWGYPIGKGDLCNISIGQGSVESTPLQVAQAMAAIGNRSALIKARLVLQVQDFVNSVVHAYDVSSRPLFISYRNLEIVHRGMYDVVNHGRGTGKRAAHPNISVSGKTGTGQWNPALKQNVAWFAGFAPSEYPVYSFSAIYEGDPGESVGGGRVAGPIVGDFFKEYLTEDKLAGLQDKSDLIRIEMEPIVENTDVTVGSEFRGGGSSTPQPVQTQKKPKKKKSGGGGLFKKLFGSG